MKVLFLFMTKGSAPKDSVVGDDWKKKDAGEYFQKTFGDECYFQMLQSLIQNGTISDCKVFFESDIAPGKARFVPGAENWVIPEVNMLKEFIDDDTIIFIRGGFKHWHDFFLGYKGKNWLMIYAANTGRDKWKWWDVVFDDLKMQNVVDRHERYQFPFIKPTNESVFGPAAGPTKYDLCIGASNIHDKKGQWKTIKVMECFKEKYGYYPSAVMPGGVRRSLETSQMIKKDWFSNEIHLPGMLTKPELSTLFSSCRIFMHLGTGGQNDRGILEAHACGIPVILSNTSRFTPLLKDDGITTHIFPQDESYEQWADRLFIILKDFELKRKAHCSFVYKNRMGYAQRSLPLLTNLFKFLGENPEPTLENKIKLAKEMEIYDFIKEIS